MADEIKCQICDGQGWVCENHPERPWDGVSEREDACGCGAGEPCKACNDGEVPRMAPGTTIISDIGGGYRH